MHRGNEECDVRRRRHRRFSDTPTLPAGGSVTYLLSAVVLPTASDETIVNTASVGSEGDSDPSDNTSTSTTIIVIFRDGFETASGSVGSSNEADVVATLDDNATFALDPNSAPHAGLSPVVWLRAVDTQQREAFRVEVVDGSAGTLVRAITRTASGMETRSEWTPLKSTALGVAGTSGSYEAMLVVSGGAGFAIAIPSWATLPLTVHIAN